MQFTLPTDKEVPMQRTFFSLLAIIAVLFSLNVFAADDAAKTESSAAAVAPAPPSAEELAGNPAKYLRSGPQADNMGYVFAAVYNPNDFAVANVYVRVVHFDATTRQPDGQSDNMLVAATLGPKEGAKVKLEGAQVYKQADLNLYRVLVVHAELAK